jgi:hypothetical protein
VYESIYLDDRLIRGVRKVSGLGSPTPRRDVVNLASRHGAEDLTKYYEGRVISLSGDLSEATDAETWAEFDELKSSLQLGTDHVLRFNRLGVDEDDQLVEVTVASPVDDDWEDAKHPVLKWGVTLFAADPRIYEALLRVASYDPAAALAGGGLALPLTFPLTFAATTTSVLEILTGGNTSTPPVLTLRGPAQYPTFDNDTTDKTITTNAVLGVADTLSIDVEKRQVTLNGELQPSLIEVAETEWWELVRGTNQLRVRGTGMSLGETLFTVQYRNARI